MNDLNKRWEALAEYQPYADKGGLGEAWAKMCSERTVDAIYAAADAAYAVYADADAVGNADTVHVAECAILRINKAIKACEEALAQPEQEPVQDLPFGAGGGLAAIKTLLSRDPCAHASTAIEMIDAILNTHAAQCKPLLASEIVTMYAECPTSDNDMIEFARAIEAAHGIKE